METIPRVGFVLLIAALAFGCQRSGTDHPRSQPANIKAATETAKVQDDDADIQTNLAKLPAEDRKLAEGQVFCAVESENRLGSMGTPVKILLEDSPVFLCCRGCVKKAQRDPRGTLAKVKELKAMSHTTPGHP